MIGSTRRYIIVKGCTIFLSTSKSVLKLEVFSIKPYAVTTERCGMHANTQIVNTNCD